MKPSRRYFLHAAAGVVCLPVLSLIARAQAYPTRPVRWIVGFAPSGGNDIVARIMGQWLSERLGQPFVIENRPGASGNIATEVVVRSPPDGYSLLLVSINNTSSTSLYNNLSFNLIRDIVPVAGVARVPLVMVLNSSILAKTIPEFITFAKANSDKINMASAGNGSIGHLAGEMFNMMAGVKLVHVPYRGNGPALTAVLGGQVEVLFSSLPSSMELIRSGQLRGLASTSAVRLEALPDLQTVAEFLPGYEISTWYGVGAPTGTPADVVEKLNKEIGAGLADPKIRARFADLGDIPMPMTPSEFKTFIATETEKWGNVIKTAKLKPD